MFLNLLFKAIKADPSEERMRAFIKRLLQVGSNIYLCSFTQHLSVLFSILTFFSAFVVTFSTQVAEAQPSQLLCGLLFLLSEVLKARPELGSLKHFLKEEAGGVQKFKDEDDDDEEEHYEDVKEEDADSEVKKEGAVVTPGWTFKGAAGSSSVHSERNCYDPTARNPLYCGAGHTALWELERLSNHFHPSGKHLDTYPEFDM